MGDRVVEGCEVEVSDPSPAVIVMFSNAFLEGVIRVLPTLEEEDAVRLLKDIAEDYLELKLSAAALHPFGGKIGERLQDNLVLNVEESEGPVEARCLWNVDPFWMMSREAAAQ
jgi:hypothetical protein